MDFTSLLGRMGGGGAPPPKSSATATSVIGGAQETEQLKTLVPWIVGGLAVVVLAFAAVTIAVLRR